jgi:phosphoserine phosphatase
MNDPAQPISTPALSQEQLRLVLDVSRSLAITTDLDTLLARIARAVPPLLGCERASVFLHDPATEHLWTQVALQSEPIRVTDSSGIVGLAFQSNQIVHCADAYADSRFNPEPDRRSGFTTRNLLAAPMVDWGGKPVGVLQAINKINGAFGENDANLLRLLADQAGVAIQRWNLQKQAIESSTLQHELDLARKVQDALIPKRPPSVKNLSCTGWTRPASRNGGDIYDLWKCGDQLGVLVADASGHGMGPALVVAQVRALVRTLCETDPNPARIMWRINDRLSADLESGRFVTAFLGFISPDGILDWASSGHGPTVVRDGGGSRLLQACWPPLGFMGDDSTPAPETIQLGPGASLMVLSDGITEAFDAQGNLFGIDRVLTALESGGSDPDTALASVRAAVVAWQGKEEPMDDQTLVFVKRES